MATDENKPLPFHHFSYARVLQNLDLWEIARAKRIVLARIVKSEGFRERQDKKVHAGPSLDVFLKYPPRAD